MQPYPAYKNSGIAWLGEIPAHWDVRRTKYLLKERDQRSFTGAESLLSVSQYTGVTPRKKKDNSDVVDSRSDSLVGYKLVQKDDLVINIMLSWNGSLGVSNFDGVVSPAYCIYRFGQAAYPKFYHYLYKTNQYKATFKAYSTGVVDSRLRLYSDKLGRIESILPSLKEQQQIARYLDWQIAKINTFIKAKKKLIALLKEQKQNIINEAVTKGINPNVALKDSGVEWLGKIPEHWETAPLKRFCIIQNGITLGGNYLGKDIVSKPYLRVANVQNGYFSLGNVKHVEIPKEDVKRYELKNGDVLVTEGGDLDKLGRGFVWESQIEGCLHQNHIFAIRVQKDKLLPTFLSCVLNAKPGREYFTLRSKKTTNLASTNSSTVKAFILPNLEVNEQQAIVDFIEKETGLIERTIARTEREIELIQEYRTRLVSDVVTGKVDVRDIDVPDFEAVDVELDAADDGEADEALDTEDND